MLHVRMDTEMKRKATETLAAMGLTASEAVRLFFHRIAVDQAFPLELKVPNAQTRRAMAEADYARRFLKDWKRLSRSGRYDMNRLKSVISNDHREEHSR